MDEMGPAAQPEIDRGHSQFRRDRVGRSNCAPGAVAREAWLVRMPEVFTQGRPQSVRGIATRQASTQAMLLTEGDDEPPCLGK